MIRQVDSMAITEPIIGQQVGPMTVGTSKINMWGKPAEPPTNVGDIQPTPEVTLNEPPVSAPDISSVSGYMAGKKEDVGLFEAEQLRRQKEIESQQKTDGGILGFLKGAQGKVDESIAEATKESDLTEYNKEKRIKLAEYAKLEEQYNKLEQEKNEAIARIEDNAGGLLDRAVNQEIARIERNYAIRQGTISANMKAKAAYLEVIEGGIDNAMQYIDQATKDATRALEFEVDAYKLMSEENEKIKEYLDEPMVAAFEAKVKEKEDELAFQREIEKTKIIESIKSAYDKKGITSPLTVLPEEQYGTDEYYSQLIQNSSGGKELTGEQTTPLTKASIVLNQIGELAETIRNTNTDPLLGILRSANPYDVKARLIQAQLRATVPNLARGVYGEVGVLTDTDIENYVQTLPNIKTPKQANELVLAMTLSTIRNSMRAYLESYANSGRDVSGFSKQYDAMNEKIDKLVNTASSGAVSTGYVPEQQRGFWSNIGNFLFGED